MGKLRSNFVGTEFTIYDNGVNPKNAMTCGNTRVRRELGSILFESNIFGSRGPRKMTVLCPRVEGDEPHTWRPMSADDTMAANYKNGKKEHIYSLENRAPRWNDQSNYSFKNKPTHNIIFLYTTIIKVRYVSAFIFNFVNSVFLTPKAFPQITPIFPLNQSNMIEKKVMVLNLPIYLFCGTCKI